MFHLLFPVPSHHIPHTHVFLIASDSDFAVPIRAVRSKGFPLTLICGRSPGSRLCEAVTGRVEVEVEVEVETEQAANANAQTQNVGEIVTWESVMSAQHRTVEPQHRRSAPPRPTVTGQRKRALTSDALCSHP
ncbi:hypothetical protein M427DRAFT_339870 [Gonapodya prolifera JEL478]|uniref:NYN domain-containing protein n=1 Tax=Gonapodya prolifera (strain JEL478) TaxID=1344416 RepID=A0A139ACS4_GONPJ|nr:hypothetical protein M427DRAFT_339870 [Gonapodya prolifera JEL478]|eukprot:KXS14611.1 hypothetical protein M427DRAFT_339870 [Gonapodya prolifera JEL478]